MKKGRKKEGKEVENKNYLKSDIYTKRYLTQKDE